MSDIKNYSAGELNTDKLQTVAHEDTVIDDANQVDVSETAPDVIGKNISLNRNSRKRRKKLPIVADIVIGIVILVLAAGIAIGSYFIFRYYANDFGEIQVEYSFLIKDNDDVYNTLKNKDLYMDIDGNTVYFGRITGVEIVVDNEDGNSTVLAIKVSAKHKRGSGYLVGENRIAVGSEYTLRTDSIVMNGTVVELAVSDENGGK